MSELQDRLSAALADRYRIERELGQGGMATVYLAQDLRHDRNVALKVLKPELAAVLGAERFVVEIKTTAALQHPHILPLFDSGTADGFLYYVMPFIDGETLRDKLNRETQLGVDEAVRIATQVADALDYAHRHGVIHRDIKPENILLHDGRPMVADFGIALAVSAAAGGRMTETGLSLGTPHYMSPEQATADKEITARSDIYSLASVLYEMLAGRPPYLGGSAQQVIMKIITEEAVPVTQLRKSVPPNVAAAVAKALEKLPADRFESARQFAEALGNPAFTHGVATPRPVTVRRPWIPRAAGIAVAAILVTAAVWGWRRTFEASPRAKMRLLIDFPRSAPRSFSLEGRSRSRPMDPAWRTWVEAAVPEVAARGALDPSLDRLTVDSVPGSEERAFPGVVFGGDSLVFAVGGDLRVFSTISGGGVATIRRGDAIGFGLAWSRRRNPIRVNRWPAPDRSIEPKARHCGRAPRPVVYFSFPYWVDGDRAATVTTTDVRTPKPSVVLVRFDGARAWTR